MIPPGLVYDHVSLLLSACGTRLALLHQAAESPAQRFAKFGVISIRLEFWEVMIGSGTVCLGKRLLFLINAGRWKTPQILEPQKLLLIQLYCFSKGLQSNSGICF